MKFKIIEEVKKVPEDYGITNYKFKPDGTLDVFEDVNLWGKYLTKLPFNFGKVNGYFNCSVNKLTNLKGAPKVVNGDFYCYGNRLKNLKGAPEIVNGNFNCDSNKLKSLEGINLDGISGNIIVNNNPDLKLTEKEELWITLNPGRLILKND